MNVNAGPMEQLANLLMTPEKSGVYLTRQELLGLARVSQASLRFNERKRMMLDIFRSTQDGAELVALLERLVDFCTVSLEQYRALVETYPMAAAQLQPWMDRATRTVELLLQTQQEVQR